MNKFRIFKQVPRIIFGSGSLDRIDELLPQKNIQTNYYAFIIDNALKSEALFRRLNISENDFVEWFSASENEPTTDQVDSLKERVNNFSAQEPLAIVGIGGGSTMDVAKALSVVMRNEGSSRLYQGWDLVPNGGIFKIGVPTIFGSGAEASRTAVLMGFDRKFGINSDHSMFDGIILDSTLMNSVPKEQRFYSGMDCYIHCVESLQGTMINELAKANASKALELCESVFMGEGTNDMLATASYMGGVSIVNSEVGICHALSYGLSLELGLRHGYANCIAFNLLENYYGEWVLRFKKMLQINGIALPKNICSSLSEESVERMIDMTLKMERPLTNALGDHWRDLLTRDKIRALYRSM